MEGLLFSLFPFWVDTIHIFHFIHTVVGRTYMKISYGQGDAGDDHVDFEPHRKGKLPASVEVHVP